MSSFSTADTVSSHAISQSESLVAIVASILNIDIEEVSIESDLFSMGFNSLSAMKLINDIEKEMKIKINVNGMFGMGIPNINNLLKLINK